MAIKGSLKEASLPDVLQLLTMGGKTVARCRQDGTRRLVVEYHPGNDHDLIRDAVAVVVHLQLGLLQ